MTTLSDLVRLQEEATPGPWEVFADGGLPLKVIAPNVTKWHGDVCKVSVRPEIYGDGAWDAEFIAAARNFDFASLQTQYEAMREFIRNAPHGSRCMDTPDDPCLCGLSAIRKKLEMDNA